MTQKWSISVLCFYALLVGCGGSSQNNSTACDSVRCLMLVAKIGPMISKHEQVKPRAETLKNMNELCVDIKECFKAAKCKKGAHTYESMRDACEYLELMTGNVQPCMKKFYSAVYNKKYDCTKTRNYLTENLAKRRESYTSGRFCFFEVIGKECSQETVGILSSNFNYDNLINVLTTVPGGFADNCNRLHHSFNKLQCEALELDITAKEKEITSVEAQTNDTNLAEFLQLLRDAERCITKSCSYSNIDLEAFKSKKEWLELHTTEFYRCTRQMALQKAAASRFPCLGNHNIGGQRKEEICKRYKQLNRCTRQVMKAACGENAIENYGKASEIIKQHFNC